MKKLRSWGLKRSAKKQWPVTSRKRNFKNICDKYLKRENRHIDQLLDY